jgi:hypothetical protein
MNGTCELSFEHGMVDLLELSFRCFVVDAYNDAVWMQEILHGRALAEEFRI